MDFCTFFSKAPTVPLSHQVKHTDHPSSNLRVPGLTFSEKPYFQEIIPQLAKWGQNVLLLGQSNAGKSYFLKQLLSIVKPKRLVVISNTSANQYRQDGMDLKHYSTMPESIDETNIKPESYVDHRRHSGHGIKARQSEGMSLQVFYHVQSSSQIECVFPVTEL